MRWFATLLGAVIALAVAPGIASAATIGGTVTGAANPLSDICVSALSPDEPGPAVASATSDIFGHYGMTVAPGTYKVVFKDCSLTPSWAMEYWDGELDFFEADVVDVTSGNALDIDATLVPGRRISGAVGDVTAPIAGVCVEIYRADDATRRPVGELVSTQADGTYATELIPAGQYKVRFWHCSPTPTYVTEWWDDAPHWGLAAPVDLSTSSRSGIDATMSSGWRISGRVTSNGADGIAGICVSVWPTDAANIPPLVDVITDADGTYRTAPLRSGSYKVQFRDCSAPMTWVGRWWHDKPDQMAADPVTLVNADLGGIDATLQPGQAVSGQVTSVSPPGVPIQGACVNINPLTPGLPAVASGTTDANGNYSTDAVPAGSYKVSFRDCTEPRTFVTRWWDGKGDQQSADTLVVGGSPVAGIDAALPTGYPISGKVISDDIEFLPGICVAVSDPSKPPGSFSVGNGFTNQDGTYSTDPVPPGTYKVQFSDCSPPRTWVTEWWKDKSDMSTANPVVVTSAPVPNVNGVLSAGHSISGTVTSGPGGTAIQNICVWVNRAGDPPGTPSIAMTNTDASGNYTAGPLTPGDYVVQFVDCRPSPSFIGEYYNDTTDRAQADAVTIGDANVAGIDAALTPGHTIAGTVTAGGGNPIAGSCVGIWPAGSGGEGPFLTGTFVQPDGSFRVGPMPAGEYLVAARVCSQLNQWFGAWWDGVDGARSVADAIPVNNVSDPSNLHFVLEQGRVITGIVTTPGGTGIPGVCVGVFDAGGIGEEAPIAGGQTQADGTYVAGPLENVDDTYRVQFDDCNQDPGYVGEWYSDKPDFQTATNVPVTGQSTAGIDAVLAVGHTISGNVGAQGICVQVTDADDEEASRGGSESDADGNYRTSPLPPGNYKVGFTDCNEPPTLVSEWWDDSPQWTGALPIAITSSDVDGIDADLAPGRTISGTVTRSGTSTGLGGICVDVATTADENDVVGWATTNPDGTYTTSALPAGDYRLRFGDCNPDPGYVSEWFDDKATWELATPVTVADSAVTGKDVGLAAGHAIKGTVTNSVGAGIEGVCPDITDLTGEWVASGCTGPDGTYVSEVVVPGTYKVQFNDDNGTYVSEWWNNKDTFETADPVDLTTSNRTLDAVLATGGKISGTVRAGTGGSGTPLAGMCVGADGTDVTSGNGTQTGADGTYVLGGLKSGHYDVTVSDCREDQSAGSYHPATIENVTVTAPGTTAGVDANMGALDDTAPNTFLTSAPTGLTGSTSAAVTFASNEDPATFQCRLDDADWQQCDAPASYTGLAGGLHTIRVRAVDAVGHEDDSPAVATWTVDTAEPLSAHQTAGTLPAAGGWVGDDPLGTGPTASNPVTTAVRGPGAGTITLRSGPSTGGAPVGYSIFGSVVHVTSTVASTAASPLRMEFVLDASLLPAGTAAADVAVFRNGVLVPGCMGSLTAAPDPCVLSRTLVSGGDVEIVVLSSSASAWNFGVEEAPPGTPGKPTGGPLIGTGSLSLNWTPVPGASQYTLAYRDLNDADWSTATVLLGGPAAYTYPGTAPEGTLVFRARADAGDWSAQSEPFIVDRTPPVPPSANADRAPDGAGWYRDTVTVSWSAQGDPGPDGPGSGVEATSVPAGSTLTSTGTHAVSGLVRDRAGNASSVASASFRVDADPPVTSISCPSTVTQGVAAAARWSASDLGSGLATPASGEVALSTAAVGAGTASAPGARDVVGHGSAAVSCSYTVVAIPVTPASVSTVVIATRKATASTTGVVPITLTCANTSCAGRLTLTAKVKGRTTTLGSKAFSIAAGRTTTVKIKLSKANLKALKAAKRLTATARVRLTGMTGSQAVATVRVSAPPRR